MPLKHISIVLGNGFDIDLGLPTRYSDYAKSREFRNLPQVSPFNTFIDTNNPHKSLWAHLQSVYERQHWFDVEEEIYSFAIKQTNRSLSISSIEFDEIKDSLKRYITHIVKYSKPRHESLAYHFMKDIVEKSNADVSIYNFNYTNCLSLCGCQIINNVKCYNIHGSLDSDIALGYYDYKKLLSNSEYTFMDKSYMLKKAGFGIEANLLGADEVIFFGHSLNQMDFSFFRSLFDYILSTPSLKQSLTFICLDNRSELDIKNRITGQGVEWRKIIDHLDNVTFIHTHLWNESNEDNLKAYQQLCHRTNK